jgi:D-inositol-3-phosphate glycosyltransferase
LPIEDDEPDLMPVRRLAIFSVHTSPLAQPGSGDGGGMNVYVRSLASSLARAGIACDVLTRADAVGLPTVVELEPGVRVVHLVAGPEAPVARGRLPELIGPFTDAARVWIAAQPLGYDVLHANYWISGAVAHTIKHELGLPLVSTFHTLARVKAEAGIDDDPEVRGRIEQDVIACSDLVLASTAAERDQFIELYGADPTRLEIAPPGVDHDLFFPVSPAARAADRAALGLTGRVLLFAGRVQPLKGVDLAVRALSELEDRQAVLVIVGGASGDEGHAEQARVYQLVRDLGLDGRVRFVPPQRHPELARYYRAADVCIVPSHTESFGLVALEAASCGTPVVAAAVGGLRSLVVDGVTGFLVEGRDAASFARPIAQLFADDARRAAFGAAAEVQSRRFAWSATAGRLRRLYGDLLAREPVQCR